MEGALLGLLLFLLILQPFSNTDVVLHQLVLVDVGRVVLLNYKRARKKKKKVRTDSKCAIKKKRRATNSNPLLCVNKLQ